MDETASAARDQFDRALETIRSAVSGAIGLIEVLRSQNHTLALSLQVAIETIELMQRPDIDPMDPSILGALEALRSALSAPPVIILKQGHLTIDGIPIPLAPGGSRTQ